MNRRKRAAALCLGLSLAVVSVFALRAVAAEAPRITKEEVKGMLGNPEVIIVDVRSGGDWNASSVKIKGAVREDPRIVSQWMNKYPKERSLIFYCAWANEATSASVALQFIEKGYTKVLVLKGGWDEWVEADFPTEKK